jgi:elongation factor G
VKIHLSPGAPGAGYVFQNKIQGGAIPKEYIGPIDEGVKEALTRGLLTGHPVPDVRVELYDGSHHEMDSSDMAFRIAGSMAFQDAAKKAKPVLLEPIMRLEITLPGEQLSDASAAGGVGDDLIRRRAQIQAQEVRGGATIVYARVPLATMLGYASDLRQRTLGRATFTLTLDRYEPVGGGPDGDDDRNAYVGWPVTPRLPLNHSAIALPEPD